MKITKKFLASSLGALTLLSTVGLSSSTFAIRPSGKPGLSTRAKVLLGLGGTIGVAGIVTALVLRSKSGNDSSNSDSPSGKLNVTTGIDEEPENLPDNENNGIKDREPENSDDSWYLAGWTGNNEANEWKFAGWSDPNEARIWRSARWGDLRVAKEWNTPEYAREWKDAGWDDPKEAISWCNDWSYLYGEYEKMIENNSKLKEVVKERWNMTNSQIAEEARKWHDIGWNDAHVAGNWFFSWKLGYIKYGWTTEVNLAQEAWKWYNAGWNEVKKGCLCSADCYFACGMWGCVEDSSGRVLLGAPKAALELFRENGNSASKAAEACRIRVDQQVRLHSYGPWD